VSFFVQRLKTEAKSRSTTGRNTNRPSTLNDIQGVSEIRVLILTSGRTRQFMKLFSITFCKIRKSFPRFFPPFLSQQKIFALTHRRIYTLMANLF
jgi:hypothetical protein